MSSAAMFTAITGAEAQQSRIDVVSNNIANVNTNGYKRSVAHFEDLLYETVSTGSAEGGSPTGLQFGRGTRIVATNKVHTTGTLRQTGRDLDVAIEGRGFLAVTQTNGNVAYTRDGSLRVTANGDLVNAAGLVLDPPITLPQDTLSVTVTDDGRVRVRQPGAAAETEVGQLQLFNFPNDAGLQAIGSNLFLETEGSGAPIQGSPGEDSFGQIAQGTLEQSNVNIAEELVNLILAQRAFEANTRVISASDEMLRFVTQR